MFGDEKAKGRVILRGVSNLRVIQLTVIRTKNNIVRLFAYKNFSKFTITYLLQNSKGKINSKVMLLRAWGIISDLIAFSQDLGGS